MSSVYQNLYPLPPQAAGGETPPDAVQKLRQAGLILDEGVCISGSPRIAFTRVAEQGLIDRGLIAEHIDAESFSGCIRIGASYLESGQLPAFHSQPVKLTCVQINDGLAGKIHIGDRVALQGVAIVAYQSVRIGDDVQFGPLATIMDSSGHPLTGRGQPGEARRIQSAEVRIGNHAWIGAGATILKGVCIGEGAIVGAQAVVSIDVPDYCVAVGNPARIVKRLSPEQARRQTQDVSVVV
ncbi:acyltransferase [Chromobacterium sp. IIBBL 290-4]|uniref:acyltransferase n=1 Tax=Chromobacterium sp. IIBBL 290-4 TaxID=2953890 RepID=UPI0020B7FE73|nr:acyltransferase [Chromobacterium sp. IIBBL 290-4]UTH73168.1 acyltransferase [Chromobacterium sp. IIBBL 290-4]